MLQPGDAVPHFTVAEDGGGTFTYSTIWQRKGLVLVTVPGRAAMAAECARQLRANGSALSQADAVAVVTADAVPGLEDGGIVVADRWGEIVYVAAGADAPLRHSAGELVEWARHVQQRCPECEGEAK